MKPKDIRTLVVAFGILVTCLIAFSMKENPSTADRDLAPATDDRSSGLNADSTHTVVDLEVAKRQLDEFAEWLQIAEGGELDAEALQQGIDLAKVRRQAMKELIKADPEAALAAAMSRAEREQLPAEIAEHVEQFVSMSAPLDVMQGCFQTEDCEHAHDNEFYRATVMDGREYRVHVYGDRLNDLSLPETSMHGIALDGHLAVNESRVRVLESGETLPAGTRELLPGEVAVEANGEVTILASMDALEDFEASIRDGEDNPTAIASDSGDGTSTVTYRPSQAWANGPKKLLVIMVDFSDLPGRPIQASSTGLIPRNAPVEEEDVHNLINGPDGVREFYQDGSFGKTDLLLTPPVNGDSPDVTEVLRLPQTASYYSNTGNSSVLGYDARVAAAAAGYNLADYDRVCTFFTNLANFDGGSKFNNWGGRASVGGDTSYINGFWDFRVIAHELGHNWGLKHANLWKVSDGNPGSLTTGTSQAYGDSHDTMGAAAGSPTKHFSHWAKSLLWWIPDSSVTLADTSGVYRVHRFDGIGANLNQPRAVKIVRDEDRDYWIGYRRGSTNTSLDNGAYVLWGYNYGYDEGDLLDMNTPNDNVNDAGLAIGQTYEDVEAGISFTTIAQGGSGTDEWLDMQVSLLPRVSLATTTVSDYENNERALVTVNRTQSSTGSISVNYSTSPGTALAPSDYTTTSGTLTWAAGDMSPKTILVPLVDDGIIESSESFSLTLSSPVGAALFGADTTTITINNSNGVAGSTVPVLVGLSQASAESDIVSAQLSVGNVSTDYSETVTAGNVISQGLMAGSNVAIGAPVDLVVSLGAPVVMTTVPNVIGLAQATAESNIAAAQLAVGNVTTAYSGTVAAGDVISQSLTSGSSVEIGAAVDLVVSSGTPNQAPVASNGSVTTDEDTPVAIVLIATDADGNNLSYSVVSAPSNGSLSGSGANLTYTPDAGFVGSDSFTFIANDGVADSNVATISITVNPAATANGAAIYEPFSFTAPDTQLGGNTGGEGLSNDTWTAGSATAEASNLTFGSLPTSGSAVVATGWNTASPYVGVNGTALNGLLADNGELWMSFLYRVNDIGNARFTVGLGDTYVTGNGDLNDAVTGAQAIGLAVPFSTTNAYPVTWETNDYNGGSNVQNAPPNITSGSAPGLSSNTTYMFVLRAQWAADGSNDSLTLYMPASSDLGLGSPLITVVSDLSQDSFDTLFFSADRAAGTLDEIRFGASYADVIGASGGGEPANQAPVFASDPMTGSDANEGLAYSGTLAGSATDADGDALSYAKTSGPAWLNVANNGALSGTPTSGDVGINAFTVSVDDGNGGSATATLNIAVIAAPPVNQPPAFASDPMAGSDGEVDSAYSGSLAGSATDADGDSLSYAKVSGPAWLNVASNGTLSGTPTGSDLGANAFTVSVNDGNGGTATAALNITVNAAPLTGNQLARTTVSGVSNTIWTTVDLGQSYNSLVVVATPIYPNVTLPPVVTRVTNVTATGFDLKVDRADGLSGPVSIDVSIIALEEGVYTQAEHGVTMEAVKFNSTITSSKNSWVAEARSFQNSYTNPVVVGQVMSTNDPNWSVFWSMGDSRMNPVDAANLNVGKHVGEDSNVNRADETIGYIVIESGSGTINGVAYEAALGAASVKGFGDSSSPYTYSLSGSLASVSAAAVSMSAMDGKDGAWAVLSGDPALTTTSIGLHACEDTLGDSEQRHATEQVGYIVFE